MNSFRIEINGDTEGSVNWIIQTGCQYGPKRKNEDCYNLTEILAQVDALTQKIASEAQATE